MEMGWNKSKKDSTALMKMWSLSKESVDVKRGYRCGRY